MRIYQCVFLLRGLGSELRDLQRFTTTTKLVRHIEEIVRQSAKLQRTTPSPPLFKDTRGQKKWLFWYHQHGCTRTWQRLKYYVTPKFCTWCVNSVKKPGKVRFKVFPRKFLRREVLLQVHVTRFFIFFLNFVRETGS